MPINVNLLSKEELLLDNYIVIGTTTEENENGCFEIRHYYGTHSNEYLVVEVKNGCYDGKARLFDRGMVKLEWDYVNGKRQEVITVYDKGKALYCERWDLVDSNDVDTRIIVNTCESKRLYVVDRNNGNVYYEGEYDEKTWNREGYGYTYNSTGELVSYCRFINDEVFQVINEIEGDQMIEYDVSSHESNKDGDKRHPVYCGEYVFDNQLYRHGKGYLIDSTTGKVAWEGHWDHGAIGKEGKLLTEGWYTEPVETKRKGKTVKETPETTPSFNWNLPKVIVTDALEDCHYITLVGSHLNEFSIPDGMLPELLSLKIESCDRLVHITIGDKCCPQTSCFEVIKCSNLETITIGKESFNNHPQWKSFPTIVTTECDPNDTHNENSVSCLNDKSRFFRVKHCVSLEELRIDEGSFCDYAGGFELLSVI